VSLGLARRAPRRGFCPACWIGLPEGSSGDVVVAGERVRVVVVLSVAAAAWVLVAERMASTSMAMGLGGLPAFLATWTVMMAAMMLPSASPLVSCFAGHVAHRRWRHVGVVALLLTYLAVWVAFGSVAYVAYRALGMPWPHQTLVDGATLVGAGLYALSPLQRASQARCREVCALDGPLPFGVVRAGVLSGWRYGLSCLGCSGALMVAMVLVGMSSLAWSVVLAAVVLTYKLTPTSSRRVDVALVGAVCVLGVVPASALSGMPCIPIAPSRRARRTLLSRREREGARRSRPPTSLRPTRVADGELGGARRLAGHHAARPQRVHLLGRGGKAGDDPGASDQTDL
jgi:predicted metal-binding membrane protein